MRNRLGRQFLWKAGLACAVAALAHSSLASEQESKPASPVNKSKVVVVSVEQAMTVVKDPLTGVLRPPTDEERAALIDSTAVTGPDVRPGSIRDHESGARGIGVGEATMTFAVVTRNADGTLTEHCVQGPEQAKQIMKAAPGKAVAHSRTNKTSNSTADKELPRE